MRSFNAVILAGGFSSRMGEDKAELVLGNETLLERCKRIAEEAGAKSVFISRAIEATQDIRDEFPHSGPLGGIHAALKHNSSLPMLAIPVDLPLLDSASLRSLVERAYESQSTSHFKGQFIPVVIWQPESLIDALEERLKGGENLSLRAFFGNYAKIEVELSNPLALENANTPEDWRAILKQVTRQSLQ